MSTMDTEDDMKNALKTPVNFGKVFEDLANSKECKTLYVIETDDNPRDFSAVPKIYGAYWATSPDPVNQIAIKLWSEFGSPTYRDEEDNLDGNETKAGDCYASSACLGMGQKSLSLSVRLIRHSAELRNFRTDLVKQIVASRGLSTEGDKAEMIKRAQQAKILPE